MAGVTPSSEGDVNIHGAPKKHFQSFLVKE